MFYNSYVYDRNDQEGFKGEQRASDDYGVEGHGEESSVWDLAVLDGARSIGHFFFIIVGAEL